ncbi:MAG: Bd3614 family nucleic acid deaminase [Pyrinomonadaceae bacterium]
MPTIIERAYHRILHLAGPANAAAAAWVGSAPQAHSVANPQVLQHASGTPIVNLLQHGAIPANAWLVSSYPPTAACVGMLNLMGFKRIVYRNVLGQPANYNITQMAVQNGNAFMCQFDNTQYAVEPVPGASGNAVVPLPTIQGAFPFAGAATNLIDAMQCDIEAKRSFAMMMPFAIASIAHGGIPLNPNRHNNYLGQNVASVMVDANWNLLYWGLNNNSAHATFHGETNAVQAYQGANGGAALPAGGKLFTTLEPCAMCSGQLVHCAGLGNQFEVVCGQKDPMVRRSALQAGGNVDGQTGNARQVSMTYSKAPAFTTQRQIPSEMKAGQDRINNDANAVATALNHAVNTIAAVHAVGAGLPAPPPVPLRLPPPIPTTRYLEQSPAKFADMQKILEMSAAVWLPAAQRQAWRTDLQAFLQAVHTAVG